MSLLLSTLAYIVNWPTVNLPWWATVDLVRLIVVIVLVFVQC